MSVPTQKMQAAARKWGEENPDGHGGSGGVGEDGFADGIAYAADLIAGDLEACAARCHGRKGPRGHDDPQWVLFTMFENEYLEVAAQIRGGEFLP